ncbi:unnamed protein product [Penicillium salamii]|uniref:Rhodopsin domain-containing protein n=1 Tax=Penicillium salamii TaxID=1612424 RepID=A0A9W4NTM6_9EURO|nr:unnamed protein product [Penicillium salamii]CAG8298998.1 unnamed protein product [Penicillium salamii]CAG8353118.1 unnamed protein product [Penicillium salamii]CAG8359416.1 unnamed protein product [Penicillium salamii]CAG8381864.1 unnamed protein product [Penicillium salamii]
MAANSLTIETWTEYGIGMLFLSVRLYARLFVGGLGGLRLDDAFAVAGMIFWTMQTVIIQLLGIFGNNIGLNEQTALLVPDSKVPDMILGSKLAFMNWIWYICYIWCLKGVLLCLYWKLTQGTWHRHLVTAASGFCIVTWLVCLLTHICLCTPVTQNWQIKPYAGDNCTLRSPLYIVIATFNVLSDICIILIPIPILAKLQVPLQRKLILVLMFSSGIFIMICTVLRAYYSLSSITNLGTALGWADRECFVAAIVVSLPGIKPLFRNTSWLGSSNRKNSKNPYYRSDGYNGFGSKASGNTKTFVTSRSRKSGGFELDSVLNTKGDRLSETGSEEHILDSHMGAEIPVSPGRDKMAIRVTTEYALESEQGASVHSRPPV